jgi:hypothetical protein
MKTETDVPPVVVQGKAYYVHAKNNLSLQLLEKIQPYPEEHRYIYHDNLRYNDSEGVIFARDEAPLRPGLSENVKKWKWPDIATVNFSLDIVRIERVGSPARLSYNARVAGANADEKLQFRELHLIRDDQKKLWSAVGRVHNIYQTDLSIFPYQCTAEFYFDGKIGEWRFVRLSTETSTFSDVAMTLELVAENLDSRALLTVFCPPETKSASTPLVTTPLNPVTPKSPVRSANSLQMTPGDTTSPSPPVVSVHHVGAKRPYEEAYSPEESAPSGDTKRQRLSDDDR